MRSIMLITAAVVLAQVGFAAAPVTATEDTFDTPYYYTYFDEPRLLGLRTGQVAVFEDTARSLRGGEATMAMKLGTFGIESTALTPVPAKGWSLAAVPTAKDTLAVENWVSSLADAEAADFVSPVLLNEFGHVIVTPTLMVRFDAALSEADAELLLGSVIDGEVLETAYGGVPNSFQVRCQTRNGMDVLNAANLLASLPEVVYAEPDFFWRGAVSLIPNDTYWISLWGLHQSSNIDMDGPEAWDITTGSADIKVVIMDLGIDQSHPDLNQIPGQDFTDRGTVGGGPYNYCDNHGTQVAGCVSAIINNGIGVVGIAPGCKSVSAKIGEADTPCTVYYSGQSSWISDALYWARDNGYRVTNASVGTGVTGTVTTAYNTTRDDGVVHFSSSGNDGVSSIGYPASLTSVNAIGAIRSNGNRASFSNYGTGLAFVAPGQNIYSTDRVGSAGDFSGNYAFGISGTSFASPYAAGVAALLLSVQPALNSDHVELLMATHAMDRGDAGYDTVYGWGLVKAYDAMVEAQTFDPEIEVAIGSLPVDGSFVNVLPVADNQGLGSGVTPMTRIYESGTSILYTATAVFDGRPFKEWRLNGTPQGASVNFSTTLTDDISLTAVYAYALDVYSEPSGATIDITPVTDAAGATTSGATPRSIYFHDGEFVTLTAAAELGIRSFVEWQDGGGATITTNPSHQFSVSADAQYTAIYEITGFQTGDVNCDGAVNFGDIDPFVMAITNPGGYVIEYPDCDSILADCNGDGLVNNGDIDPFVAIIAG